MKSLDAGHEYVLDNFADKNSFQSLKFIKKVLAPDGNFATVSDGTTNEEVLKMLIDRMQHLQLKNSCRENSIVITRLEEALLWLQKRTEDRKTRGVEGTPQK